MNQPTWQSRVAVPDCPLIGRISYVWKVPAFDVRCSALNVQRSLIYFRVSFPIPSPFIDDWAVYRRHEVRVVTGLNADPELKAQLIASMRPKISIR